MVASSFFAMAAAPTAMSAQARGVYAFLSTGTESHEERPLGKWAVGCGLWEL